MSLDSAGPRVRLAAVLGSISISGLAAAWVAGTAHAQGSHPEPHGAATSLSPEELLTGIVHGATLANVVLLAGLVAFVALVWLPVSRAEDATQGEKTLLLFCRWLWALFGLLIVTGFVELSVYAVRASGDALSPGLLGEALFDTRVGLIWIGRLGLGLLTAAVATYAAQQLNPAYWWGAAVVAIFLLMTLTQQSHAAAEGRLLPFASDWVHVVAASLWMGGLLGFSILLIGPLRAVPDEARTKLLVRTVRRFSKVATIAVMILIVTGLYAILLHVPSLPAMVTPYGNAFVGKLVLLVVLLVAGAMNLMDRGQGEFGQTVRFELVLAILIFVATGLLTTLPPADADQSVIEENQTTLIEDRSQPPISDSPSKSAQPTEEAANNMSVVASV